MAVDWSALSDWRQALNWENKVVSKEDVYQKDNKFIARVLNPPTQATPKELAGALGIVIGAKLSEDIWKFRGRIDPKTVPNSPHAFLPDPCDPTFADNPEKLMRLVALHTTFYSVGIRNFNKVKENDQVKVALRPGKGPNTPFDLQIGYGLKKVNTPGIVDWLKRLGDDEEGCEPLKNLDFGGGDSDLARESKRTPRAPGTRGASPGSGGGKSYEDYLDDSVCDEDYEEFWIIHPLGSPTWISSYFPEKRGSGIHAGLDLVSEEGTPIYAPADGTVVTWGWNGRCGLNVPNPCKKGQNGGNGIYIQHGTVNGKVYQTESMHLAGYADGISYGVDVKRGDIIGYVGMTGNTSGGHDHFQLRVDGRLVDPLPYIKRMEKCPSPAVLAAQEDYHRNQEERCAGNGGTWIRAEKKCDTGETAATATVEISTDVEGS